MQEAKPPTRKFDPSYYAEQVRRDREERKRAAHRTFMKPYRLPPGLLLAFIIACVSVLIALLFSWIGSG